MTAKKTPWGVIILAVLGVLALAVAAADHFGIQALRAQVEKALGPESEVQEIKVGLTAVASLS